MYMPLYLYSVTKLSYLYTCLINYIKKENTVDMKLKKEHWILIGVGAVIILAMIIYMVFFFKEKNSMTNVTTGQVAKGVSLLKHTMTECEESKDVFGKSKENKWYVKYMNTMYSDGYFTEKDIPATEKSAESVFTYGKLKKLFDNMNVEDVQLRKYVNQNGKNKKVSVEVWTQIYSRLIELYSDGNVETDSFSVVATVSNVPTLGTWKAVTDDGNYSFEGLSLDYYIDNEIEVFKRGSEVIWVKNKLSDSVCYENVWIVNSNSKTINVFMYGITREIIVSGTGEKLINTVADITLKEKTVSEVKTKRDSIGGKVLASDYDYIEIEGYGRVPLDEEFKVYKVYGNLEEKGVRDILVGYDAQIFIVADGKICSAVIDRDINAENIRVLISTNGYDSIFHESVMISSSGGMTITYGDKKIITDPGEKVLLEKGNGLLDEGRVKFVSNDIKGTIAIDSLKRSYGVPSYRGSIEVAVNDSGLLVINELPLEEYLYGVVPSEMPSYYPAEALKAQAVCARTYAYKHLLKNTYNKYGAHVDDSTSFQVYKNIDEQESTNKAVNDTYGEILTYNDEPIMACFYSTSCGSTSDGNIWGSETPYLKSVLLSKDGKKIDLSNETIFTSFIKHDYDSYESDCSMFRWNVKFTLGQLTDAINAKIEKIYKNNNNNVLTLVNGEYVKKNITTIGVLKRMYVEKRAEGGVVETIIFEGTEATVRVRLQANIRNLLSPKGITLTRNNGKTTDSMSSLPSGYFAIEEVKEDGILSGYILYGGGYGHGAGMSQNGAKGMAEELYDYATILHTFYTDVELESIYTMAQ